jgi:hypothetical protein
MKASKRQVEVTKGSTTDRIESETTALQESLEHHQEQEEEENDNLNDLLESVNDIKLDHPSSELEAIEEDDSLDPEARRIANRKARKDDKKKKKAERRAQREGKIEQYIKLQTLCLHSFSIT